MPINKTIKLNNTYSSNGFCIYKCKKYWRE